MIRVCSSRDVMVTSQIAFPSTDVHLINALVYSNASEFRDPAFTEWVQWANIARVAQQDSVILGRYAGGALVDTLHGYFLLSNDVIVREQVAPWVGDVQRVAFEMTKSTDVTSHDVPALLAARYGETTWGHWLVDILPKIVIAESIFPKLFAYVVPKNIVAPTFHRSYSSAVLESLAAYGIAEERLIRIGDHRVHAFDKLFDVGGLTSDGIHPSVLSRMRDDIQISPKNKTKSKRLAIIRNASERRCIFNNNEIRKVLKQNNFLLADFAQTPFDEQVHLVRNAQIIVADHGSNLAALIYAQTGVRLAILGPAGWYDGFFTNVYQRLEAICADVRGASTTILPDGIKLDRGPANASYVVQADDLQAALKAITRFEDEVQDQLVELWGRITPRRVGSKLAEFMFCIGGNGLDFLTSGWSDPETNHCWSVGRQSKVVIPKNYLPPSIFWLHLTGYGFTCTPVLPYRHLEISLNGRLCATIALGDSFSTYILVPFETYSASSALCIDFHHPFHPAPSSFGRGNDTRNLGVCLRTLTFWALMDVPSHRAGRRPASQAVQ